MKNLLLLPLLVLGLLSGAQTPLVPLQQPVNGVLLKVTLSGAPGTVTVTKPSLWANKRYVFKYELDDNSSNIKDLFALFNGGTAPVNGVTYPGKTFTDGCGYIFKWSAGLAVNGFINSSNTIDYSAQTGIDWAYKAGLVTAGWDIFNHGLQHEGNNSMNLGTNWPEWVKGQTNYIYDSMKVHGVQYIPRGFIVPSANYYLLARADSMGYIIGSTQAGGSADIYNPSPQGNGDQWFWIDSLPYQRFSVEDRSLTDGWTGTNQTYYQGVIDNNFLNTTANKRKSWHLSGHYWANATEWSFFKNTMDYLQTQAGDSLWVCSMVRYKEYREIRQKSLVIPSVQGSTVYIAISYDSVPLENRYKDISLILSHTTGTITSVTQIGSGADSLHFNATTGLINVFKKTTTGFQDPAPNSNPCGGIKRFILPALPGDTGVFFPNGSASFAYNPGDTLVLSAPYYKYVFLQNFHGTAGCPLVVQNGVQNPFAPVTWSSDFKIQNCTYLKWTGSGDARLFYGFLNTGERNWASSSPAVDLKGLDSNIEMERIYARNKYYLFMVKNESLDMLCDTTQWFPARYFNIQLHHSAGQKIRSDGDYVGSSDPENFARPVTCNGTTSSTVNTIPTSHPTSVAFTVPAGLSLSPKIGYVTGQQVQCKDNGTGNLFIATITSYTGTTLTVSSLSNVGSATSSSWSIAPYLYPKPTGLSTIGFYNNIIDTAQRQGLQWSGVDRGTNLISSNVFKELGEELNPIQGNAMAFGTDSRDAVIEYNVGRKSYNYGILDYHNSLLEYRYNIIDSSGWVYNGAPTGNPGGAGLVMNIHDGTNESQTLFNIHDNVFGANTGNNSPVRTLQFLISFPNYGAPNYICNNEYLGQPLTATNIYLANNALITYQTSCVVGRILTPSYFRIRHAGIRIRLHN